MQKRTLKLKLDKETLRVLTPLTPGSTTLQRVAGGSSANNDCSNTDVPDHCWSWNVTTCDSFTCTC